MADQEHTRRRSDQALAKKPEELDDATLDAFVTQARDNPPDLESWVTLIGDLRVAAELDRRRRADKFVKSADLASGFRALHAVVVFLQKQRALPNHDLKPLMGLYAAVLDLKQNNRVDPMFTPARSRGKPGNAVNYEAAKGAAARAMSLLMEAGVRKGEAQNAVAKALRGTVTFRGLSGTTVKGWRDRLEEGENARGVSGIALSAYTRVMPPELGTTPRECAESLLRDLRATC